jgi:hypothetical protein
MAGITKDDIVYRGFVDNGSGWFTSINNQCKIHKWISNYIDIYVCEAGMEDDRVFSGEINDVEKLHRI